MLALVSMLAAAVTRPFQRRRRHGQHQKMKPSSAGCRVLMVTTTTAALFLLLIAFAIGWRFFFIRNYTIRDTVHNTTFHYRGYKQAVPFYEHVSRHPFLRSNEYNNNNPEDQEPQQQQHSQQRVCFVHIGKTAGSTLACFLGFQHPRCRYQMTLLPGYLPRYTVAAVHASFDSCAAADEQQSQQQQQPPIGIYLFTVRDPLQRLISWFTYERNEPHSHSPALYEDCGFQSVNQLGESMTHIDNDSNDSTNRVSDECSRKAWRAVTGVEGFKRHNYYNYGYYWERLSNRTVATTTSNNDNSDAKATTTATTVPIRFAVIRTEHIEQDWWSVERTFFDYAPPPDNDAALRDAFGRIHNNPSRKRQGDRHLSSQAQRNLCAGLCREIQIYKLLLRRAENLMPEAVAVSLQELAQSCPAEAAIASENDCPDYTPFTA